MNNQELSTIEPDLKLKAKLRGLKAREQMLEFQGSPWTSDVVASYLRITPEMVSKRHEAKGLLGLTFENEIFLYPAWQFTEDGVLSGLDQVLSELDRNLVPSWDKLRFFVTPDVRLDDKTPVEYLQSKQVKPVLELAKVYGLQIG